MVAYIDNQGNKVLEQTWVLGRDKNLSNLRIGIERGTFWEVKRCVSGSSMTEKNVYNETKNSVFEILPALLSQMVCLLKGS